MQDQGKLQLIKTVHTLVWVGFVILIGSVLHSGLMDNITPFTWMATGLVLAEGVVLLLFNRRCPLTILARQYSHSHQANFDIFLPVWLARHNQLIFTSIYLIGLLLLGYRVAQSLPSF